jgi:hypothetical protein
MGEIEILHSGERHMTQKHLGRGVLVVVLCMVLVKPARADKLSDEAAGIIAGIVAVTIGVTLGVAFVIVHYSKKRTLTGCVMSGANGMSVTDEADKKIYTLSGNTADIKPGNRMRLHGQKVKSKSPDQMLIWETTTVNKDFGVCTP